MKTPKKKKHGILFWMGTVCSLLLSFMVIWAIVAPKSLLKSFGWKDEEEVKAVTVKKLVTGTLKKIITVRGRVQAYQEITITSQVSGEIKRIFCKEGEAVKKDQMLVEIDPKTLVEDLVTAKSRLEQAKLALATLKIKHQECQEKLERSERLFRQGLNSTEEISATRYACAVNKSEMERASWQIKEMEGEVASIDKKLGQTKICSSMDGVVTKLILKEGEGVIQGLVNTSGTAIMKISDMTQKGVIVWISESDVPFLKPGQPVDITSPNFRGHVFKAHLSQIAMTGQADQQTDLTKFEVKTLFDNLYPELLLEMSAVVNIELGCKENVLKVPLAAIQTEEKREEQQQEQDRRRRRPRRAEDDISNIVYQDFVFVVEDGKLAKRHITTGLTNDKEAEVIEGLGTGQLVVIGPSKLFAKMEAGKPVTCEMADPPQPQDKNKPAAEKQDGKESGNSSSKDSKMSEAKAENEQKEL
jgi:HlyD family secretion protein